MANIAYIEEYEAMGLYNYQPLKPTGKWKIESCAYYENKLFIQHRGLLGTRWWISEDKIFFSTRVFRNSE